MPANNTSWLVSYWQGLYGGLGHLYGPARSECPMPHLPFALDNGAWVAFKHNRPWSAEMFTTHVERYAFGPIRPSWVVVPDVVGNAFETLALWRIWAPILRERYGLTLALAVQNGMTAEMVMALEVQPDIIFVGGDTEWKWATVHSWCSEFPRVHVGRVNTAKYLEIAAKAGAESCDGTGWFRGRPAQILELGQFLARQVGRLDHAEDLELRRVVALSRIKHMGQKRLPLEVA